MAGAGLRNIDSAVAHFLEFFLAESEMVADFMQQRDPDLLAELAHAITGEPENRPAKKFYYRHIAGRVHQALFREGYSPMHAAEIGWLARDIGIHFFLGFYRRLVFHDHRHFRE